MADTYLPIRRPWSLRAIQESAGGQLAVTAELSAADDARIWADLVAEYDARLLQAELLRRAEPSPAMASFLDAWAADEEKHADSLTWLYRRASGATEADVQDRLALRRGSFDAFDAYLDDEFRLCLMFAYDEAMSTKGYGDDVPFYRELGRTPEERTAFAALLRELRSDEAMHYRNAVELIAERHPGRGPDVAAAMDEIVELDANQREYQGAFLLDHASDQFDPGGMRRVGAAVTRAVSRRLALRGA